LAETASLVRQAEVQGITFQVDPNGKVKVKVPKAYQNADIVEKIKAHKEEVKAYVRLREFSKQVELGEKLLRRQGYCFIYSHVLRETVAIVRDESVLERIPKHIVVYSPDEIWALKRGVDAGDITEEGLQLIHQAKRALRAKIVS